MEATCSSETSVDFQRTSRRYIPEDVSLNLARAQCIELDNIGYKSEGRGFDPIGFFNLPNPSSLTMALGLTPLLTEMSTRNLLGE
jgi:hypothetical protein